MKLLKHLFDIFRPRDRKPGYQIDTLLYLNDWDEYSSLLKTSELDILSEVFIFRAWLYNFAFRRATGDRDQYVEPMLDELIGLLGSLGAKTFIVTRRLAGDGPIPSKEDTDNASQELMDLLVERFNEYDASLIQVTSDDSPSIQDILAYVYRRFEKHLNHDPLTVAIFKTALIAKMINDVFNPATDIAKRIAR